MANQSRLERALEIAQRLGYEIRHEWLEGAGGGACEIRGKKVLFVDLAQSLAEQYETTVLSLQERVPAPLLEEVAHRISKAA